MWNYWSLFLQFLLLKLCGMCSSGKQVFLGLSQFLVFLYLLRIPLLFVGWKDLTLWRWCVSATFRLDGTSRIEENLKHGRFCNFLRNTGLAFVLFLLLNINSFVISILMGFLSKFRTPFSLPKLIRILFYFSFSAFLWWEWLNCENLCLANWLYTVLLELLDWLMTSLGIASWLLESHSFFHSLLFANLKYH